MVRHSDKNCLYYAQKRKEGLTKKQAFESTKENLAKKGDGYTWTETALWKAWYDRFKETPVVTRKERKIKADKKKKEMAKWKKSLKGKELTKNIAYDVTREYARKVGFGFDKGAGSKLFVNIASRVQKVLEACMNKRRVSAIGGGRFRLSFREPFGRIRSSTDRWWIGIVPRVIAPDYKLAL
ncbi:uncharacterized protein JCM6883_000192 [Sporobolomyces salmoneus]|uniref:uncharacterized protein n=1 Tax=Sporobolomyces salmoneus TaxID=183962 RepID=UPI003178F546